MWDLVISRVQFSFQFVDKQPSCKFNNRSCGTPWKKGKHCLWLYCITAMSNPCKLAMNPCLLPLSRSLHFLLLMAVVGCYWNTETNKLKQLGQCRTHTHTHKRETHLSCLVPSMALLCCCLTSLQQYQNVPSDECQQTPVNQTRVKQSQVELAR